jgi:hypothetical protein
MSGGRSVPAFPRLLAAGAAICLAAMGCTAAAREPRFRETFETPAALARGFLHALEVKDVDRLGTLPLSEREFVDEVFPEMPAAGKIPAGFAWQDLRQKSRNELGGILAYHGGKAYDLVGVGFDGGATAYETFVVHRKPRLHVRERGTGVEKQLALFGSVLEHEGRYKLFSYVVNR